MANKFRQQRAAFVKPIATLHYRPGIFAGGRTRGSSLIVPIGSRVSTFLGCALLTGDLLSCALLTCDFAGAPRFALAGGVSTDCR